MILAGDVGATKTMIALFEETENGLHPVREALYSSQEHPSLESVVMKFLADGHESGARCACFGVAGPVLDGKCRTTNLPWEVDEQSLSAVINVSRVQLLNDMVAAAYGMLFLGPDKLCLLQEGARPGRHGNVAVVAPGTGLGEAILFWDGRIHHPIASEGGHADFAPRNADEIGLLEFLRVRYSGHVSYERVLSGPGIADIHAYLSGAGGVQDPCESVNWPGGDDPSKVIAERGIAGTDKVCVRTLELFASILGAEAGNLALKCLALGGVLIGGGIAPKLLPALRSASFLSAFKDKGRFSGLLESIPVNVSLEPRAPLLGAARYALHHG